MDDSGVLHCKELRAVRRSGWFCLLAIVIVGLVAPVRAAAASAAEAENDSLEEVIVTARKVRENVHDIPLSIQVLTGEQLTVADLSSLFDLQHQVPGLVVNTVGLHGAGFALRGVADQGGMHLNGVYLGHSHLAIARMFDLDRVEVLKGPQGTMYGRNATGGSINFITRAPEDALDGELEGAFGSFDTTRLQGHLNVPVGSAAMRLAVTGSDGDGFIRNTVDDRRFGEADYWGLRGSLAVEPNERWRIDLTAQRVYDDGASAELWLPNPDYLPDPDDIHLTTVTLADPFLRIENDFVSLTAEYDLGFARARSITGYANNETNNLDDCQGSPEMLGCIRTASPLTYQQWSQELQLASAGGERIDWLTGVYYFSGEQRLRFYHLSPLQNPLPVSDFQSTADDTAWAVFSHASVRLGGGWGVTGGLRFSDEDSEVSRIGTGVHDDPELVVAAGNWDQPSWRLDLEYAPRDGQFYYAGLSTGFRSGGINTTPQPEGVVNRYDPEDLLAFEAGTKLQWPSRGLTLDAAAFHYDFDNLQTSYRYTSSVGDRTYSGTDNAAKAEVYGIDAAASLQATDRLGVTVAFVWLPKREYLDYTASQTGEDLSGNDLPRAPEWSSIASLTYSQPLARHGELSARLEYVYRSGYFYTRQNQPYYSQDAFGLLNLYLKFEPERADWYAFASGRNLTDEDYYQQVFLQAAPGYPDTYEVGVGFRF